MKISVILCVILSSALALAEGTQTWEQTKFEDFEKGTARGVAIRSDGSLVLAPQFKQLYASPSSYLWAVASDFAGNVYAAAGAPARVYRIAPNGAVQTIFEPKELQVQDLVERNGVLYAATSPDGKVYKLEPARQAGPPKSGEKPAAAWKSSVFFDPKTKYIWALALDSQGRLYIGTGDQGQIFRVTPDGQGSVFFQSDDAHIRSLAIDAKDSVIAGSDGSGLIYRISPAGEAFVLYSAPKKEITAVAADSQGNIYAAGQGEKRNLPVATALPSPAAAAAPTPAAAPPSSAPSAMASAAGGSDIYKIAADGAPTVLWSSRDDLVYALAFASAGGNRQLIAGTGNKGRVLAIAENPGDYTDLLKATANQITGFAAMSDGSLVACTSNLGKVFRLGPGVESGGDYESDVFDARLFSRWGRVDARGSGNYELFARSGNVENPDRDWSPWKKIAANPAKASAQVPPARFFQWKAVLHAGDPAQRVESVTVNYLSKNVAPVVDEVEVQTAAVGSAAKPGETPGVAIPAPAPPSAADRGSVKVRWQAHDDNDDQLSYSLFYRGDEENNWKPLSHDKITEKTFSFDSSLLPDGGYLIRVVATDAPSHSPEEALSGNKQSARFEIDSTPPRIEDLHAAAEGGQGLHVTFRADDSFSPIRRAEYSLDAGDWQFVAPVGELSDARAENYDFNVPLAAADSARKKADPAEHVVAVRVYDRFNNVGAAKVLVK